jgi:hypothetical protein
VIAGTSRSLLFDEMLADGYSLILKRSKLTAYASSSME